MLSMGVIGRKREREGEGERGRDEERDRGRKREREREKKKERDVNISFRSSDAEQRALSISGALLWNKLPTHMKKNQSIKNFKKT
ncbi:hypothetical protein FHG87_024407 [Trinorchestia longiramus]|nr:hypothetical protein FHG87_024407 [Trinorchestia longiramus]